MNTKISEETYNESVIFSKRDFYARFDEFEKGDQNILLITGFSGSGKTTLAESIAQKYNADVIQLDYFGWFMTGKVTLDNIKEESPCIYEFYEENTEDWNKFTKEFTETNQSELIYRFMPFCFEWCKKQPKKKFIIEGLQIYYYFFMNGGQVYFPDCPIIIKGTSCIKSVYRALKRGELNVKSIPRHFKWVVRDNYVLKRFEKAIHEYYKENIEPLEEGDFITESYDTIKGVLFNESPISSKGIKNIIFDFGSVLVENIAGELQAFAYTEDLLKLLKKNGYDLYYISNWDKKSFEKYEAKGIFNFRKHFKGGIVSYEVEIEKPDNRIYELLLGRYNLNANECLFFDDKPENIKAANAIGIHGILFNQSVVKDIMGMKPYNENSYDELLESGRTYDYNLMTFSNESSYVKEIIETLPYKEKCYIGRNVTSDFADQFIQRTKNLIYREVLLVDNVPCSFLDVYNNLDGTNVGTIVTATRSGDNYRRKGYCTILLNRCIKSLKGTNIKKLVWENDPANIVSRNIGTKNGFSGNDNKRDLILSNNQMILNEYTEVAVMEGYDMIRVENKDIIPMFFVTTFTYTNFGKVVRAITNSTYSHSAIGFKSDLSELYSFNAGFKGLSKESLEGYIGDSPEVEIYVGVVLLTREEYISAVNRINMFIRNKDKTSYSFMNIFNIAIDHPSTNKNEFSMICSQFVDTIFKSADIDLTGKDSSIATPFDLRNSSNKKVFFIYEGLAKDYDSNKTKRIIKTLKRDVKTNDIYEIIEIHKMLNTFKYGIVTNRGLFIKRDKLIQNPTPDIFVNDYHYLSPQEFLKARGGVCWDYTEYQYRELQKKGFKVKNYYIELINDPTYDTHTITVVNHNEGYLYLESSFYDIRGVYFTRDINEIFKFVLQAMMKIYPGKTYEYFIIEYDGYDNYGCTCEEYMDYMCSKDIIKEGKVRYIGVNMNKGLTKIMESSENEDLSLSKEKTLDDLINNEFAEIDMFNEGEIDMFNKSYIFSRDNLEINTDKWMPGTPLWITGTSGDGKSTLSYKLAKEHNAIVVSIDYVLLRLTKSKDKFELLRRKMGDIYDKNNIGLQLSENFVNMHPEYPRDLGNLITGSEADNIASKCFNEYFRYIMTEAQENPLYNNKMMIVEGSNICYMDIDILVQQPLIILGCSRLRAFIQRYKRERSAINDGFRTKDDLSAIGTILKLIRKYKDYGKDLDDKKDRLWRNIENMRSQIFESAELLEDVTFGSAKNMSLDEVNDAIQNRSIMFYNESGNIQPLEMNELYMREACKNLEEARKFLVEVGKIAKKYNANYFIVTDGASKYSNQGNPAVKHAGDSQIEWEEKHGFDPNEDWDSNKETLTESSRTDLNKKCYDDFSHYVKWCRMDDSKFIYIEPLKDGPIVHISKKKEKWLLLATFYRLQGKDIKEVLNHLHNNIRYGDDYAEFHTCYLPGDMFIYTVIPDAVTENVKDRLCNNDINPFSESEMGFLKCLDELNMFKESTESDREKILNRVIKSLTERGLKPDISKSSKMGWITKNDSGDFGPSLCIAGLGYKGLNQLCSDINSVIKPMGGRLHPDNYGTAFLTIKESGCEDVYEESYIGNYFTNKILLKRFGTKPELNRKDTIDAINSLEKKFKAMEKFDKIKKTRKKEDVGSFLYPVSTLTFPDEMKITFAFCFDDKSFTPGAACYTSEVGYVVILYPGYFKEGMESKIFIILHEIGHIRLGHTDKRNESWWDPDRRVNVMKRGKVIYPEANADLYAVLNGCKMYAILKSSIPEDFDNEADYRFTNSEMAQRYSRVMRDYRKIRGIGRESYESCYDFILESSNSDKKRYTIEREWGVNGPDGAYNACVKVKGVDKPLRGRSEILIIKGDQVFIKFKEKNKYDLPGGGWEKDEGHKTSAVREAMEEARIECKNVEYLDTYVEVFDEPKNWVKDKFDKKDWWYGYYTEVYVGEYDKKYTGHIDDVDKDPGMLNKGKFYPIKDVYSRLSDVHQEALAEYIDMKDKNIVLESADDEEIKPIGLDEWDIFESLFEATEANSYIIRDEIYPRIAEVLSTPVGDKVYRKAIEDFVDRNTEKLHEVCPTSMIAFTDSDKEKFFDIFGIEQREIVKVIERALVAISGNAQFRLVKQNPIFTVFYCALRYYTLKGDQSGVNSTLIIHALSSYPSIFSKYFQYGANPSIMQYTADHLTEKFIFKQEGHVFGALRKSIESGYNFLKPFIKDGSDKEVVRFIQRVRNDQNSIMKKIKNEYNKNRAAGKYTTTQMDTFDNGALVDDFSNDTSQVETISQKVIINILTNGINLELLNTASNIAQLSIVELRYYLTKIMIDSKSTELESFINAVLFIYLFDEKHKKEEIHSKVFIAYGIDLFRRTNSNNKNVVVIKDLLNKWAEETGIHTKFRREATRICYKKGIYWYILLSIQAMA